MRKGYTDERFRKDLAWILDVVTKAGVTDWALQAPGRASGLIGARRAVEIILEDRAARRAADHAARGSGGPEGHRGAAALGTALDDPVPRRCSSANSTVSPNTISSAMSTSSAGVAEQHPEAVALEQRRPRRRTAGSGRSGSSRESAAAARARAPSSTTPSPTSRGMIEPLAAAARRPRRATACGARAARARDRASPSTARGGGRAQGATAACSPNASCAPPSAIASPNGVDSPKNGIAISAQDADEEAEAGLGGLVDQLADRDARPAVRRARRRRGRRARGAARRGAAAGGPPWRSRLARGRRPHLHRSTLHEINWFGAGGDWAGAGKETGGFRVLWRSCEHGIRAGKTCSDLGDRGHRPRFSSARRPRGSSASSPRTPRPRRASARWSSRFQRRSTRWR